MEEDFAGILEYHMDSKNIRDQRLADTLNREFGDICRIGRTTTYKWRTRTVLKIRDWRQVAAVANILHLNKAEAEQLLSKAGFPKLLELWKEAEVSEQRLLVQWVKPENPLPVQLPERAVHFTDRTSELQNILRELQLSRTITICGSGGMGKSALAAEAVWRMIPDINVPPMQFPDGVIYFNFEEQSQSDLALEHIALSYGIEPRPTPVSAARRALAGKRTLLLLESAEKADDLPKVLQIRGGCGVLVTTRNRTDALEEFQDLKPLPKNEAINLLKKWGGDLIDDETLAVEICDLIGGLPLAVRLVGRYLSQKNEEVSEYLKWLQETPLVALSQGDRQDESVSLLLEQSLTQVSQVAQDVLAAASLLSAAPFSTQIIVEALNLSAQKVRQAINELIDYGLLVRRNKRLQFSHTLIHTYGRKRLIVGDEVVNRLGEYYIGMVGTQNQLGIAGYRQLNEERLHIIAIIERLNSRGKWQRSITLVESIDNYLYMQGLMTDRATVIRAGLQAAHALGQVQTEETFFDKLGRIHEFFGQYEKALHHFQRALALANKLKAQDREGQYLGHIGNIFLEVGRFKDANDNYHEALILAHKTGDQTNEARQLNRLGLAHRELGMFEEAKEYHQQSIQISQDIGNRRLEAAATGNMGLAYRKMGYFKKAVERHRKALLIAQDVGYRQGEAEHSGNLGLAYEKLQQYDEALKHLRHAIKIAKEIGYRRSEANQTCNLGVVYQKLGDFEQAITLIEEALAISREIGTRRTEGNALSDLADVYLAKGQVEKAIGLLEESLAIFEEIESANAERVRLKLKKLRS